MHALVPLLIAAPVVLGIAITLGHILTIRYPDLGNSQTYANDGKALAVGVQLYAKPGHQYTGMLYAPLMPAMLAPLYRIFWWDGWSLVLVLLASAGLAVLVGGVAASGMGRPTWERVAGGIGVGGIAFWIVTTDPWNGMFTGRLDQLSWLFALSGLCVLALGVAHRWPAAWPAVVLLSAGFWTKQSALVAVATGVVAATWWATKGVMPWRTWRRFVGGLALLNLAVFAVLLVVTRGWIWFFFFDMPSRHHADSAITPYLSELVRLFAIPVIAVAVAAGVGWRAKRANRSPTSFVVLLGTLLVAFLALQLLPAFLSRRRDGAGLNQYIGMLWALGLLLALAHREAHRSRRALIAGVAVYASLAAILLVPVLREGLTRPGVVELAAVPNYDVASISPAVVSYARSHLVFESSLGVISPKLTREVWPHQANLMDILAAGEPADYVVNALIDRRFDAVTPFNPAGSAYVAQDGRASPEYLPALNALIRKGYGPGANGAPSPLLGRRPVDIDLSWTRHCFQEAHPLACITAQK